LTEIATSPARAEVVSASVPGFAERVVAWQRTHGRHDLPWQDADAYRIWLSEIMLQQTQVATVLPYYLRFIAEFPTVRALAAASLDRVLALWSGLGYYRRAHHLHAAAKMVVQIHGGRFPGDATTLQTLPGIGRSTAAAIAAFASGECNAILDGNVKRVLARHRGIEGWAGNGAVEASLWRAADILVRKIARGSYASQRGRDIAAYTQGLMDIGATICTRTRPRCDRCPLADDCIARREARIDDLPTPRPRKPLPQRAVTLLVLQHDQDILLEQRPPLGIWAGLWSFPEVPEDTDVAGYVAARFQAACASTRALPPLVHAFTHFGLTMHPIAVSVADWPRVATAPGVAWFTREAALAAAIPAPVRKLLRSYR
jgi:A/G-specific adenine glycosylase